MKKLLFIVPFICIILLSCAPRPRPIIRLHPISKEIHWHLGKEVVSYNDKEIAVAIAFEEADRKHLIFYIEIANQKNDTIMIVPSQFYYTPYIKLEDSTYTIEDKKIYAIDPEEKILEIEKEISREDASYAGYKLREASVGFLNFLGFIANFGKKKTREEMKEEQRQSEEDRIRNQEMDKRHKVKIKGLNNIRDKWKSTTLRKTSLGPNQIISGRVYFPKCKKEDYFIFYFPINNSLIQFPFQKELHYP